MISSKSSAASGSKIRSTEVSSNTTVGVIAGGVGTAIQAAPAAEGSTQAMWSRYIDSRMKQFGTR